MKSLYQNLPKATVQIECKSGNGTGFHFIKERYVVTNDHVVETARKESQPIKALTESGEEVELDIVAHSPADRTASDYAILETKGDFEADRITLQPSTTNVERGTEVWFSGFPHGVSDLLVHNAYVSGFHGTDFYLDGAVNGGNSGGPITNSEGEVVGITTYRRFIGQEELSKAKESIEELSENAEEFQFIVAEGVSYGSMFESLSNISDILSELVYHNANTGIGMGQPIRQVEDHIEKIR